MIGSAHVLLAAEIQPLRELGAWEPVRDRLAALVGAMRGGEGATGEDVQRLRVWSHRWSRLTPFVRQWYAAHAPTDASASAGLRWLLDQPTARPPDPVRWAVYRAFRDSTGWHATSDLLFPRLEIR